MKYAKIWNNLTENPPYDSIVKYDSGTKTSTNDALNINPQYHSIHYQYGTVSIV